MIIKATAKLEEEIKQELKLADPSVEKAMAIIKGNENGTPRHSDEGDRKTQEAEV